LQFAKGEVGIGVPGVGVNADAFDRHGRAGVGIRPALRLRAGRVEALVTPDDSALKGAEAIGWLKGAEERAGTGEGGLSAATAFDAPPFGQKMSTGGEVCRDDASGQDLRGEGVTGFGGGGA
jgi:hypothetical protein